VPGESNSQSLAIQVARQIAAAVVSGGSIRSENGADFVTSQVPRWLRDDQVETICIAPTGRSEDGNIEIVQGRCPDQNR